MKRTKGRAYSKSYPPGRVGLATRGGPARLAPGPAQGAVRNLQELYTVAIGVAIAMAMDTLIKPAVGSPVPNYIASPWGSGLALAALFVTIIPFYHGAMRHLDQRYVEERGAGVRRGALLADFVILFAEACIFTGMALQLASIESFAMWLGVLLMVDALWGILVHACLVKASTGIPELGWAGLNVGASLVLWAWIYYSRSSQASQWAEGLALGCFAIALVRTMIDYWKFWAFYFPAAEQPFELRGEV